MAELGSSSPTVREGVLTSFRSNAEDETPSLTVGLLLTSPHFLKENS